MINITDIFSFIAALFSIFLGIFVLQRDRFSFVHRVFALGMVALAAESVFTGLCIGAIMPENVSRWLYLRNLITAFLPGIWLLYSLSFSRANYREFISQWKWVLVVVFVLPLATFIFFNDTFFLGRPEVSPSSFWLIRLGLSGYIFHLLILVGAVLILMNLERTLRNSFGRMRWQIKFMILGIGSIFAVRIYTASQTILFHTLSISLELVNNGALIIACILISRSLFRTRTYNVDFYPSQSFLYNSVTVLLVGAYLLIVGILAKFALYFNEGEHIPLRAFFVLAALIGLFVLFLSDRLRKRIKRFISRHFNRPLYDYRKEWMNFTESTGTVTDVRELCSVVTAMISKTFETLSVSIWIFDEAEETLGLCGSTDFSGGESDKTASLGNEMTEFTRILRNKHLSADFDFTNDELPGEFENFDDTFFEKAHIQYCVPLTAGDRFLGVITLSKRVGGEPFTIEDFDLLGTIASQVGANLLSLMLSERLRKAKEMEAFQTMSAFFVHDLKNLASKLSLTMQNLPVHFDNPEFRKDALKTISHSLDKMNMMSSRLTSLSQRLELHLVNTNIDEVVTSTLPGLDVSIGEKLVLKSETTPNVSIDPEQIQKVLLNLILNANEATGNMDTGEIMITSGQEGNSVFLSVKDNGCGMSKEFIEKSLFHPFQTTKNQGMGIGLYHSKTIIDAHRGKIEVESTEGKGSEFKVLLPITQEFQHKSQR
ncbi:MAG TPA: PEP-CTERM system histidine kinase PrsK [Syntrophales bacterium]|nr:PEP-CTERM system histidine kinase PrsK [Syntrophales bacterium]